MMAFHQRMHPFKSRIDFEDPSTTKPPSLAKSAVLQALEEEERQQAGRGKAGWQQRPSRSRQREPIPGAERAKTPCINRDTVLLINRRLPRHRSCDNIWPPARSLSPRDRSPAIGAAEGLKRVAWPPPAEYGDDYEQHHPSQNKCSPQAQQQQHYQHTPHQPQSPAAAYQQPKPQYQPHIQPQQQPLHQQQQQQQPRERIIPIQRATSHISPAQTPKSPVNQLKYPPSYPPPSPHTLSAPQLAGPQRRAVSPLGGSTVAFSGGRAVLPQQQQQRQPTRPVSAPYYQQQQHHHQQQQHQHYQQHNRYSSPSTASLASPRSPQIIGGGGYSPRGWSHVKSPVPVYNPAHQQRQQQYVPPPFQPEPAPYQQPTTAGYGYGYGPRKPDPLTQHQPQYQPQATEAFQPVASVQQQPQQQSQLYQQTAAIPQQHQQQQQQQQPYYHQPDQFPFVTTLRKEPPMSQEPAPVYQTQPVAAIYQGGTNMRGDQKWPPAEYKKQSELDNEERLKLAQQPAFRPRKVQKDYSSFFAKNALNQTYPAYRAPPGTQHHG
ncbi:uncharacterized protein LOC131692479 isoform X3 [Topomyia yanbarensis]|uniref:uncharacterized protein LOC131692479 isoform X3 n=1 Tax=Topomyia yanbarensis TaxID=2498891 RepID=UPI00273BFB28|nr:uncharacterized protein LOC131692479 isoform X3 [Topomyia yanbarensis]